LKISAKKVRSRNKFVKTASFFSLKALFSILAERWQHHWHFPYSGRVFIFPLHVS